LEIVAIDRAGGNFAQGAQADDGEVDLEEGSEFLNGLQSGSQILNFGNRESGVVLAQALRALAEVQQPVFVAIGKRLQQDCSNHAENRERKTWRPPAD